MHNFLEGFPKGGKCYKYQLGITCVAQGQRKLCTGHCLLAGHVLIDFCCDYLTSIKQIPSESVDEGRRVETTCLLITRLVLFLELFEDKCAMLYCH